MAATAIRFVCWARSERRNVSGSSAPRLATSGWSPAICTHARAAAPSGSFTVVSV